MSLVASNISLSKNKKQLLKNINLSVSTGEIVALVGPNGCGKSSLLRTLSGDYQPTTGNVSINQQSLCSWDTTILAKQLAVLSQQTILQFSFTAREVVLMGAYPHDYSQQEKQSRADCCLDYVGAMHLSDRNYLTLSGGEQQRIQLARVLMQISPYHSSLPRYLLLDEPISALDLKYQIQILTMLRNISKLSIGIIIVIHDINLALRYTDRLIFMSKGAMISNQMSTKKLPRSLIKKVFDIDVVVTEYTHNNTVYPLVMAL